MKKIIVYGTLLLLAGILSLSLKSTVTHVPTYSVCDSKGVLLESVKNIFEHIGVSVATLKEANAYAQAHLLRKGERWDKQEEKELHALMHHKKDVLLKDLASIGMVDSIEPQKEKYTYALLMGACTAAVKHRLDYLAELKQRGIEFNTIVLLGGERQLRDSEKNGLPDDITTEAQMMSYLCADHPVLKDGKVLLVNAPFIKKEDGSYARPTTESTVAHFAEMAPTDGSCLVISHNPYVIRQTKVAQRMLDQSRFPTDGAGKKIDPQTIDIVMLMDECARTLYEEYAAKGYRGV